MGPERELNNGSPMPRQYPLLGLSGGSYKYKFGLGPSPTVQKAQFHRYYLAVVGPTFGSRNLETKPDSFMQSYWHSEKIIMQIGQAHDDIFELLITGP